MKFLKAISPYIVVIGIIALIIFIVVSFIKPEEITYTQFLQELSAQNIEEIELEDNLATIKLKGNSEINPELTKDKYTVKILSQDTFEDHISEAVAQNNPVEYTAVIRHVPFILKIVPYILIIILFLFFMYILLGQAQGGGAKAMNFGRSRARMYTSSKVKFEDVAGAKEEKEEMAELVSFLASDNAGYINGQCIGCDGGWCI